MWNCELSLQFSFRSSSPLLFVFEGGNWYLDWYADFCFMMFVCSDFGFIFGAVVFVLSRFLSRKPDFVPQCLGYPHKPDQVHLTMLCVAFFLENLFAISDIPNFASRPDPVSRLVNSLTPHTKLCKILLTRTVDLVSGELYRQPWFGFYTSPRQAFASLTWNFLSRIWHSRLSFRSHFYNHLFESTFQSMSSFFSARSFLCQIANNAFTFWPAFLSLLPIKFKVNLTSGFSVFLHDSMPVGYTCWLTKGSVEFCDFSQDLTVTIRKRPFWTEFTNSCSTACGRHGGYDSLLNAR